MRQPVRLDARPATRSAAAAGKGRARKAAPLPDLDEARERLAAARDRAQPWLTPAGLDAVKGMPELLGPETYRKR